MKTRYTIIEPGPAIETDEPIEVSRLATMQWIEVEFKKDQPTLKELQAIFDPHFGYSWERVAVNSFKGAADMFVADDGALQRLPVNQLATLVYWTATILHEIDAGIRAAERAGLTTYEAMREAALLEAADRLTVAPAYRWAPQIHGRAILFDNRVWF